MADTESMIASGMDLDAWQQWLKNDSKRNFLNIHKAFDYYKNNGKMEIGYFDVFSYDEAKGLTNDYLYYLFNSKYYNKLLEILFTKPADGNLYLLKEFFLNDHRIASKVLKDRSLRDQLLVIPQDENEKTRFLKFLRGLINNLPVNYSAEKQPEFQNYCDPLAEFLLDHPDLLVQVFSPTIENLIRLITLHSNPAIYLQRLVNIDRNDNPKLKSFFAVLTENIYPVVLGVRSRINPDSITSVLEVEIPVPVRTVTLGRDEKDPNKKIWVSREQEVKKELQQVFASSSTTNLNLESSAYIIADNALWKSVKANDANLGLHSPLLAVRKQFEILGNSEWLKSIHVPVGREARERNNNAPTNSKRDYFGELFLAVNRDLFAKVDPGQYRRSYRWFGLWSDYVKQQRAMIAKLSPVLAVALSHAEKIENKNELPGDITLVSVLKESVDLAILDRRFNQDLSFRLDFVGQGVIDYDWLEKNDTLGSFISDDMLLNFAQKYQGSMDVSIEQIRINNLITKILLDPNKAKKVFHDVILKSDATIDPGLLRLLVNAVSPQDLFKIVGVDQVNVADDKVVLDPNSNDQNHIARIHQVFRLLLGEDGAIPQHWVDFSNTIYIPGAVDGIGNAENVKSFIKSVQDKTGTIPSRLVAAVNTLCFKFSHDIFPIITAAMIQRYPQVFVELLSVPTDQKDAGDPAAEKFVTDLDLTGIKKLVLANHENVRAKLELLSVRKNIFDLLLQLLQDKEISSAVVQANLKLFSKVLLPQSNLSPEVLSKFTDGGKFPDSITAQVQSIFATQPAVLQEVVMQDLKLQEMTVAAKLERKDATKQLVVSSVLDQNPVVIHDALKTAQETKETQGFFQHQVTVQPALTVNTDSPIEAKNGTALSQLVATPRNLPQEISTEFLAQLLISNDTKLKEFANGVLSADEKNYYHVKQILINQPAVVDSISTSVVAMLGKMEQRKQIAAEQKLFQAIASSNNATIAADFVSKCKEDPQFAAALLEVDSDQKKGQILQSKKEIFQSLLQGAQRDTKKAEALATAFGSAKLAWLRQDPEFAANILSTPSLCNTLLSDVKQTLSDVEKELVFLASVGGAKFSDATTKFLVSFIQQRFGSTPTDIVLFAKVFKTNPRYFYENHVVEATDINLLLSSLRESSGDIFLNCNNLTEAAKLKINTAYRRNPQLWMNVIRSSANVRMFIVADQTLRQLFFASDVDTNNEFLREILGKREVANVYNILCDEKLAPFANYQPKDLLPFLADSKLRTEITKKPLLPQLQVLAQNNDVLQKELAVEFKAHEEPTPEDPDEAIASKVAAIDAKKAIQENSIAIRWCLEVLDSLIPKHKLIVAAGLYEKIKNSPELLQEVLHHHNSFKWLKSLCDGEIKRGEDRNLYYCTKLLAMATKGPGVANAILFGTNFKTVPFDEKQVMQLCSYANLSQLGDLVKYSSHLAKINPVTIKATAVKATASEQKIAAVVVESLVDILAAEKKAAIERLKIQYQAATAQMISSVVKEAMLGMDEKVFANVAEKLQKATAEKKQAEKPKDAPKPEENATKVVIHDVAELSSVPPAPELVPDVSQLSGSDGAGSSVPLPPPISTNLEVGKKQEEQESSHKKSDSIPVEKAETRKQDSKGGFLAAIRSGVALRSVKKNSEADAKPKDEVKQPDSRHAFLSAIRGGVVLRPTKNNETAQVMSQNADNLGQSSQSQGGNLDGIMKDLLANRYIAMRGDDVNNEEEVDDWDDAEDNESENKNDYNTAGGKIKKSPHAKKDYTGVTNLNITPNFAISQAKNCVAVPAIVKSEAKKDEEKQSAALTSTTKSVPSGSFGGSTNFNPAAARAALKKTKTAFSSQQGKNEPKVDPIAEAKRVLKPLATSTVVKTSVSSNVNGFMHHHVNHLSSSTVPPNAADKVVLMPGAKI